MVFLFSTAPAVLPLPGNLLDSKKKAPDWAFSYFSIPVWNHGVKTSRAVCGQPSPEIPITP